MKTKASYSIIRLMAAVVIALVTFSAASCSKDDDDNPGQLIGFWELTWMDGISTESYNFYEDGRGEYDSPIKRGYFWYSIESPGHIHFKITYHEKPWGGSYQDDFVWPYSIKGDKLTIDGKTYTRTQKEATKPIELQ